MFRPVSPPEPAIRTAFPVLFFAADFRRFISGGTNAQNIGVHCCGHCGGWIERTGLRRPTAVSGDGLFVAKQKPEGTRRGQAFRRSEGHPDSDDHAGDNAVRRQPERQSQDCHDHHKKSTNKNVQGNPNVKPNNPNFKPNNPAIQTAVGKPGAVAIKSNAVKFQAGPGQINKVAFKPAPNVQFVKLGKFSAPVWNSGPKKIWWGNKWKVFVPVTALGVVVLGGAYYYPDAYLTVARPYCDGITPDGCRLNWQRVDFEDGESDWQCVQFCRQARQSAAAAHGCVRCAAADAAGRQLPDLDLFGAELRRHQRKRERGAAAAQ